MDFQSMKDSFMEMFKLQLEKEEEYAQMSNEELLKLNDEELYDALQAKMLDEYEGLEVSEALEQLDEAERAFYIVNQFDYEFGNGGFCQFFMNIGSEIAPYLSEYFAIIGASSYQKLFDDFVKDNQIDVHDLSSFAMTEEDDESAYDEQFKRYPFDEFDEECSKLYKEEPLYDILIQYVRRNLK